MSPHRAQAHHVHAEIQDVHGGTEPLCPLVIAAPDRLLELMDLLLEDGKNGTRGAAGL